MIVGLGDRKEVVDRPLAIEHTDLDGVPSLMFPAGVVRRRCDDAQAGAARYEFSKIVDVLDVVEDNKPVGRRRGLHTAEETADNLVLSGLVARANSELLGELDNVTLDGVG